VLDKQVHAAAVPNTAAPAAAATAAAGAATAALPTLHGLRCLWQLLRTKNCLQQRRDSLLPQLLAWTACAETVLTSLMNSAEVAIQITFGGNVQQ
jgi:hypothetical protein